MTFMSSMDGEYMIDCMAYPGSRGDVSFTKNENVYFLGTQQVTGESAAYLGFPGYFKIRETPISIVSRFDAAKNDLYLVSASTGDGLSSFRTRGICFGDIVIGARSGAVRYAGVDFVNYTHTTGTILKCGIKEPGYSPGFHDLLDFTEDPRKILFNLAAPYNQGFYNNTIFNNRDFKFSCLSLSNRFELPVPYTDNSFGFRLATAVTPRHVMVAGHVLPYMTNTLRFYDKQTESVISRNIIKKIPDVDGWGSGTMDFGQYSSNSDNNGIQINGTDVGICLLDSPLPEGVSVAYVPDVAFKGNEYSEVRRMDSILIDQSMRGYCMNAIQGGRAIPQSGVEGNTNIIESFNLSVVNSTLFLENLIDPFSAPLFVGVGDSNSMTFTCIDNKLIFLGTVGSGGGSFAGLDGTFLGEDIYSPLDINFIWYPDAHGNIVDSPKNRYREATPVGINAGFWLTIGNNALRYLFTSKEVWGTEIDPSHVPSRIKITNDINIVEPATRVISPESILSGRKIKFIS